jgi:hypothetical protein
MDIPYIPYNVGYIIRRKFHKMLKPGATYLTKRKIISWMEGYIQYDKLDYTASLIMSTLSESNKFSRDDEILHFH